MGLQKDAALIISVTAWQAPVHVGKGWGWGGGGVGVCGCPNLMINPHLLTKRMVTCTNHGNAPNMHM